MESGERDREVGRCEIKVLDLDFLRSLCVMLLCLLDCRRMHKTGEMTGGFWGPHAVSGFAVLLSDMKVNCMAAALLCQNQANPTMIVTDGIVSSAVDQAMMVAAV